MQAKKTAGNGSIQQPLLLHAHQLLILAISDGLITVVIFAADAADVEHAPLSVRLHGGATVDAATMAAALQSARVRAKQIVSTLNSLSKR